MKKKPVEILDPEVDDLCVILAHTILRPTKPTPVVKNKGTKRRDTEVGGHPPGEASPSMIG